MTTRTSPLNWPPIIARAAEIVDSYDIPITLRQLFYRLVVEQRIPNTQQAYKTLSAKTAKPRRRGEFPALFDAGRSIRKPLAWTSPADAIDWVARTYRVDRAATQPVSLWLGVEKNALAGLMQEWFRDLGVPVLPLGGYSSESLERDVLREVRDDGRKAVLVYAGDFDASGMDIGRSFIETTGCWDEAIRIGLSEELIGAHDLVVQAGKVTDSRAAGFIARHPEIHATHDFGHVGGKRVPVQVELDALDPVDLQQLFTDAIGIFWDQPAYEAQLAQEDADRDVLEELRD